HRNVFGLYENYFINYTDSAGNAKSTLIPYYSPAPDSVKKRTEERKIARRKTTRREKLQRIRSLQTDSSYALMTINTFSKGHLKTFFRRSFRKLKNEQQQNLVIDLRANGGGDIIKSVFLTRCLRNTPCKVADSAYVISRRFSTSTTRVSGGLCTN